MPNPPSAPTKTKSLWLSARGADAVALVAGLLLPLAFAPFDLFPLALLAPAALFYVWHDGSPGRAARRGFLFGLGMFGVGISWVYVSMHTFGGMGTVMSALATLLLAAGLALYPALLGFVQARFFDRRSHWHALLVLPALSLREHDRHDRLDAGRELARHLGLGAAQEEGTQHAGQRGSRGGWL